MKQKIVCVAGFGDDASMFEPLLATALSREYHILPYSLPGFGSPSLNGSHTLERLAVSLAAFCSSEEARIVLAHSVASIIATLAAQQPASPIEIVLSLEGNLTPEDAYFSGTASKYDDPIAFQSAFLARLDEMAISQPIIARYRSVVARASPQALWELGNDAFRFSQKQIPGEELMRAANVVYLYNLENLPSASIAWLNDSEIPRIKLEGATHWASVDQPNLLASKLQEAISLIA